MHINPCKFTNGKKSIHNNIDSLCILCCQNTLHCTSVTVVLYKSFQLTMKITSHFDRSKLQAISLCAQQSVNQSCAIKNPFHGNASVRKVIFSVKCLLLSLYVMALGNEAVIRRQKSSLSSLYSKSISRTKDY